MNFNFVSKNNIGIFSTLFLIILLSQSRLFNFLIDTFLGRIVLIIFILGISYTNKILGVVSVLFIIIMFNQSNLGYLEGFTNEITTTTTSEPTTDETNSNSPNEELKQQIKNKISQKSTSTTSSDNSESTTNKKTNNEGQEGFNIIDREGTMLKGKRSNEVPVFSNVTNDNVQPFDNAIFKGEYARI